MTSTLITIISIVSVVVIAFAIASKFKLSNRYERKPTKLSSWNRQDIGEDPSNDGNSL